MLTFVQALALPIILGVGNDDITTPTLLLLAIQPVDVIVSITLICDAPAFCHCTDIVAALAPVVNVTGLPFCVTLHPYVLPLVNNVLYVVVVPTHALDAPVTLGVGNALIVIEIGVVSVIQPTPLVSRTRIVPDVPFHCTLTVALVPPLCITPPVTVQL